MIKNIINFLVELFFEIALLEYVSSWMLEDGVGFISFCRKYNERYSRIIDEPLNYIKVINIGKRRDKSLQPNVLNDAFCMFYIQFLIQKVCNLNMKINKNRMKH